MSRPVYVGNAPLVSFAFSATDSLFLLACLRCASTRRNLSARYSRSFVRRTPHTPSRLPTHRNTVSPVASGPRSAGLNSPFEQAKTDCPASPPQDYLAAINLAKQLECSAIHINSGTVHDEPTFPHGGHKSSGIGRFNGTYAIQSFTQTKTITMRVGEAAPPFAILA